MSIFNREKDRERPKTPAPSRPAVTPAQRPQKAAQPTRQAATQIASGTKVVGQISGSAELVIEGVVEGEIDLQSQVVVGAQGRVEGRIRALTVQVGGKVHGDVIGTERVEVLASGSLEGDVTSPRVRIKEGAFFKGKVEMTASKSRHANAAKQQQAVAAQATAGDAAKKPGSGEGKSSEKASTVGGQRKAFGGSSRSGR